MKAVLIVIGIFAFAEVFYIMGCIEATHETQLYYEKHQSSDCFNK